MTLTARPPVSNAPVLFSFPFYVARTDRHARCGPRWPIVFARVRLARAFRNVLLPHLTQTGYICLSYDMSHIYVVCTPIRVGTRVNLLSCLLQTRLSISLCCVCVLHRVPYVSAASGERREISSRAKSDFSMLVHRVADACCSFIPQIRLANENRPWRIIRTVCFSFWVCFARCVHCKEACLCSGSPRRVRRRW